MARPFFARFALILGFLWLAAGALFKLFEGSPNDLPATVKALSPLGALETLRAAIAVELAVLGLVIALPRVGWFFLSGAFAVFIAVLLPLVASGETSCGCFGGNITIAPTVMLGIDAALLALLLATKPWRSLPQGSGLGAATLPPLLAVAALAPYMKIQDTALPPVAPRTQSEGSAPAAPEAPAASADAPALDAPAAESLAAAGAPTGAPVASPASDPLAALGLPEFRELRIQDLVGQDVWSTELLNFYEYGATAGYAQGTFQPDSHVVVYRQTCEHCEEHLKQIWEEQQRGEPQWQGRTIVLLRLVETKDTDENNRCRVLPEPSEKISFPPLKRGYGITTPFTFDLDGAMAIQNPIDLRKDK